MYSRDSFAFFFCVHGIKREHGGTQFENGGAINTREIWLIVVLASGLYFAGYLLTKLLGSHRGVPLTGLVGGLASSNAATLSSSRMAQDGTVSPEAVASGILAATSMMVHRVGFLTSAVVRNVFVEV